MTQVLTETRDRVLTIRFNRPEKKNALTQAMYSAAAQAVRNAQADSAVRAVLFAGQPDCFCAGNDVFFNAFTRQAAGGGVIVMPDVPGSDAWREAESRWLKPAVAQLREGVISRLDLSAGARCLSVSARALLRFWRRRKPWWEWFA